MHSDSTFNSDSEDGDVKDRGFAAAHSFSEEDPYALQTVARTTEHIVIHERLTAVASSHSGTEDDSASDSEGIRRSKPANLEQSITQEQLQALQDQLGGSLLGSTIAAINKRNVSVVKAFISRMYNLEDRNEVLISAVTEKMGSIVKDLVLLTEQQRAKEIKPANRLWSALLLMLEPGIEKLECEIEDSLKADFYRPIYHKRQEGWNKAYQRTFDLLLSELRNRKVQIDNLELTPKERREEKLSQFKVLQRMVVTNLENDNLILLLSNEGILRDLKQSGYLIKLLHEALEVGNGEMACLISGGQAEHLAPRLNTVLQLENGLEECWRIGGRVDELPSCILKTLSLAHARWHTQSYKRVLEAQLEILAMRVSSRIEDLLERAESQENIHGQKRLDDLTLSEEEIPKLNEALMQMVTLPDHALYFEKIFLNPGIVKCLNVNSLLQKAIGLDVKNSLVARLIIDHGGNRVDIFTALIKILSYSNYSASSAGFSLSSFLPRNVLPRSGWMEPTGYELVRECLVKRMGLIDRLLSEYEATQLTIILENIYKSTQDRSHAELRIIFASKLVGSIDLRKMAELALNPADPAGIHGLVLQLIAKAGCGILPSILQAIQESKLRNDYWRPSTVGNDYSLENTYRMIVNCLARRWNDVYTEAEQAIPHYEFLIQQPIGIIDAEKLQFEKVLRKMIENGEAEAIILLETNDGALIKELLPMSRAVAPELKLEDLVMIDDEATAHARTVTKEEGMEFVLVEGLQDKNSKNKEEELQVETTAENSLSSKTLKKSKRASFTTQQAILSSLLELAILRGNEKASVELIKMNPVDLLAKLCLILNNENIEWQSGANREVIVNYLVQTFVSLSRISEEDQALIVETLNCVTSHKRGDLLKTLLRSEHVQNILSYRQAMQSVKEDNRMRVFNAALIAGAGNSTMAALLLENQDLGVLLRAVYVMQVNFRSKKEPNKAPIVSDEFYRKILDEIFDHERVDELFAKDQVFEQVSSVEDKSYLENKSYFKTVLEFLITFKDPDILRYLARDNVLKHIEQQYFLEYSIRMKNLAVVRMLSDKNNKLTTFGLWQGVDLCLEFMVALAQDLDKQSPDEVLIDEFNILKQIFDRLLQALQQSGREFDLVNVSDKVHIQKIIPKVSTKLVVLELEKGLDFVLKYGANSDQTEIKKWIGWGIKQSKFGALVPLAARVPEESLAILQAMLNLEKEHQLKYLSFYASLLQNIRVNPACTSEALQPVLTSSVMGIFKSLLSFEHHFDEILQLFETERLVHLLGNIRQLLKKIDALPVGQPIRSSQQCRQLMVALVQHCKDTQLKVLTVERVIHVEDGVQVGKSLSDELNKEAQLKSLHSRSEAELKSMVEQTRTERVEGTSEFQDRAARVAKILSEQLKLDKELGITRSQILSKVFLLAVIDSDLELMEYCLKITRNGQTNEEHFRELGLYEQGEEHSPLVHAIKTLKVKPVSRLISCGMGQDFLTARQLIEGRFKIEPALEKAADEDSGVFWTTVSLLTPKSAAPSPKAVGSYNPYSVLRQTDAYRDIVRMAEEQERNNFKPMASALSNENSAAAELQESPKSKLENFLEKFKSVLRTNQVEAAISLLEQSPLGFRLRAIDIMQKNFSIHYNNQSDFKAIVVGTLADSRLFLTYQNVGNDTVNDFPFLKAILNFLIYHKLPYAVECLEYLHLKDKLDPAEFLIYAVECANLEVVQHFAMKDACYSLVDTPIGSKEKQDVNSEPKRIGFLAIFNALNRAVVLVQAPNVGAKNDTSIFAQMAMALAERLKTSFYKIKDFGVELKHCAIPLMGFENIESGLFEFLKNLAFLENAGNFAFCFNKVLCIKENPEKVAELIDVCCQNEKFKATLTLIDVAQHCIVGTLKALISSPKREQYREVEDALVEKLKEFLLTEDVAENDEVAVFLKSYNSSLSQKTGKY